MAKFLCVRCGSEVVTDNERYYVDRFHAPSCEDCEEMVREECSVDAGMWPSDWHGGWSWFNGAGWMYYPPNGLLGEVWKRIGGAK